MTGANEPRIPIVIPARNDAEALGRTLDWLVRLPGRPRPRSSWRPGATRGDRDRGVLEDLALSQRVKRLGRTVLVREPLLTSDRRFLARGPADAPPGSPWPQGRVPAS